MIRDLCRFLSFHPRMMFINIKGIPTFFRTKREFKKLTKIHKNDFPIKKNFPCLYDIQDNAGTLSGDYFHQDLLVAQAIYKANPVKHVDIGSRTDGFVAHVASYREIEIFDIRSVENKISNIKFVQLDFMSDNIQYQEYTDSISSLHAIEHFGLGRYGDPLDVNGHIKGLDNIYKMLKPGGIFYFSVPIGKQRIEFNAHRVFGIPYILDYIKDKYTLNSFSYVDDSGELHKEIEITPEVIDKCGKLNFGCGIFTLQKK